MEVKFYDKIGKVALGSRLRMLTGKITEDALNIYRLYGIPLQPKWFPVFYTLSGNDKMTITAIASEIGHSQPSVSKIINEMCKKGLVTEKKDAADGRRNLVALSKQGKELARKIQPQYTDVNKTIEDILAQTKHDLWKAIEEWEFMLEQQSLFQRVKEQRKERESANVKIVNYQPKFGAAFKELNKEWISTYFKMEEADYKALDNPKGYILDKGGFILVALYNNEPSGVCALIKMEDPMYQYELAKMVVSPKAQGKNIGLLLGQAVISKARALGASRIYLESNTMLEPAINLYHKLGFKKVAGRPTPYERCNIQMELILTDT